MDEKELRTLIGEHIGHQLRGLNAVAFATGAMPYYMDQLADAFAGVILAEVKPGKRGDVLLGFWARVQGRLEQHANDAQQQAQAREMIERMAPILAVIVSGFEEVDDKCPKH